MAFRDRRAAIFPSVIFLCLIKFWSLSCVLVADPVTVPRKKLAAKRSPDPKVTPVQKEDVEISSGTESKIQFNVLEHAPAFMLETVWKSVFEEPNLWIECMRYKDANKLDTFKPDFFRKKDKAPVYLSDKNTPLWVQKWLKQVSSNPLPWASLRVDTPSDLNFAEIQEEHVDAGNHKELMAVPPSLCKQDSTTEAYETQKKPRQQEKWASVFKHPENWVDSRAAIKLGLVTAKFPHFSHKYSGDALWLTDGPEWVHTKLASPETPEWDQHSTVAHEPLWRSLVNEKDKWTDCRARKADGAVHPRYPDFKSDDGTAALWIDSSSTPLWAKKEFK